MPMEMIYKFPCVECNNGHLCNTETFFEKQVFCWEKLANETNIIKGAKICRDSCFVFRNFTTGNGRELIFALPTLLKIHQIQDTSF